MVLQKMLTKLYNLRGLAYFSYLLLMAFTGSLFLMAPVTPLAFFRRTHSYHRRLIDRIMGVWFLLCTAILEIFFKMKFRLTGDPLCRGETSIYIMNHRTSMDWMWIWPVLYHWARLRKLKIVLKNPLKWVPGFGWAMQQASFLFMNRKWEDDRNNMETLIDYFKYVDQPIELLMFPEGTDYNVKSRRRSDSFARKNDLPQYEFVLHPRKTGFQFMACKLINSKQIKYIHDITVGYPRTLVDEPDKLILGGEFPEEVHFHVEKFAVADLPSDYDELGTWLEERFRLKEQRLRAYYSEPHSENRKFDKKELNDLYKPRTLGMYLALIFWPAATACWIYFVSNYQYFFYYQLALMMAYLIQPWWFGGFEFLTASVSKAFRLEDKKVA